MYRYRKKRYTQRLYVLRRFISILLLSIFCVPVPADTFFGEVEEVLSGDTIRIRHDSRMRTLRIGYIQCPKSEELLGNEAAAQTAKVCLHKTVEIRVYEDLGVNGVVGDIILDSKIPLSIRLLEEGLALLLNLRDAPKEYLQAFRYAMFHEKGLHARHIGQFNEFTAVDVYSDAAVLDNQRDSTSNNTNGQAGDGENSSLGLGTAPKSDATSSDISLISKLSLAFFTKGADNENGKDYTSDGTKGVLIAFLLCMISLIILGIVIYVINQRPDESERIFNMGNLNIEKKIRNGLALVSTIHDERRPECDRCNKPLYLRETFIGSAKRGHSRVFGDTDNKYSFIYEAVVCSACGRAECLCCKGSDIQAPCSWCGNPVEPAFPENLKGVMHR